MATVGLRIISGNSNPQLAQSICDQVGIGLCKARIDRFTDGEILVEVGESVRGTDAFVIQSISRPVNDHLMELLVIIDALKRASARRVTAVMPYYGYARQDRKSKPRVPITARLIADLVTQVGADRVLTMDLHAGQIQGFFNIPVDNLYASPILLPYIRQQFNDDLVMVSPDAGGVPRARAYARRLNASLALIDKRRAEANQAEAMHLIGDVDGKTAIILDDMVDTAGTLVEAARTLLENGAREVHACCTHPVLSGPAIERLQESMLGSVVVTDTLPRNSEKESLRKLVVLSSARLFAEAIKSIHNEDSISRLFEIQH
ncbi:MAG: ribose-phosphate pyrophosphokinase [Deltaproteobacteria bacterium]|nr:ribose-phosphate pyrophosphokinase [Deltaproteobacteria bacterium]MBW2070368.1 ribose-phosphate pyrophosphokinase [Deltaproteobacteria bacterium]